MCSMYLKFNILKNKLIFLAPQIYSSSYFLILVAASPATHLLNEKHRIQFDSSLSFATWSRHICGHQHLVNIHSTFEKFHKPPKVETRTMLSQPTLQPRYRLLTP